MQRTKQPDPVLQTYPMEPLKEPIGLIAGWGSFPMEIAQRLHQQGRELYVVGLQDLATPKLADFATGYRELGLLKFGQHFRFLRSHGVGNVLLAGKIFKDKVLFGGRGWIRYLPDWTCLRVLGASFVTKQKDARDDTVLNAIVGEYERQGMPVLPITEVTPQLLCDTGDLTQGRVRRSARLDAEFGWKIARQMGGLDVGQSITVKDQVVLGVEAIEGTDALIDRTAKLCPRGGFTLIKVAKPNQDMRFDVPTVGPRTVERMSRAGGTSIIVEAGRTILVERQTTLELANRLGVHIVAFEDNFASIEADRTNIPSASAESKSISIA